MPSNHEVSPSLKEGLEPQVFSQDLPGEGRNGETGAKSRKLGHSSQRTPTHSSTPRSNGLSPGSPSLPPAAEPGAPPLGLPGATVPPFSLVGPEIFLWPSTEWRHRQWLSDCAVTNMFLGCPTRGWWSMGGVSAQPARPCCGRAAATALERRVGQWSSLSALSRKPVAEQGP